MLRFLVGGVLCVATACGMAGDGTGGGSDNYCGMHSECGFNEICNSGYCENAFSRTYSIVIYSATVATRAPDGSGWDIGGGAPDLGVAFGDDPNNPCVTTVYQDTFSATWNESCDILLEQSDTVFIDLFDQDVADSDWILTWEATGTDSLVSLARLDGAEQTLRLQDGSSTLTFTVQPRF